MNLFETKYDSRQKNVKRILRMVDCSQIKVRRYEEKALCPTRMEVWFNLKPTKTNHTKKGRFKIFIDDYEVEGLKIDRFQYFIMIHVSLSHFNFKGICSYRTI